MPGFAQSNSGNSAIKFLNDGLYIEISNKDTRLLGTCKYYRYEGNDETYLYFSKIIKMLELLSKYNYPFDIKFKDLSNPTSDLVFLYEGREVDLKDIERIYESLLERTKEAEEAMNQITEQMSKKFNKEEYIRQRKRIMRSLYYSGDYKSNNDSFGDQNNEGEDEKTEKIDVTFKKLVEPYNSLIESLDENERNQLENALLVYNSCLYEAINQLVAVPNFRTRDPKELGRELYKNPDFARTTRIFVRSMLYGMNQIENGVGNFDKTIYEKLSIVKCSNMEEYIKSLISVYDIITKYRESLQLPEDLYLYRGISKKEENAQREMARSELISTTLDPIIAKKYFRGSKEPVFYKVKVQKGLGYMINPYQLASKVLSYVEGKEVIKYISIDSSTYLTNYEIMLFGDDIVLDNAKCEIVDEGVRKINVIEADVTKRERAKSESDELCI